MNTLLSWYAWLASRTPLSALNDMMLKAALRARGYNGSRNFHDSGEDFFIREVLAKSSPTVCIDIGAHVGDYTLRLLGETLALVISFEPLPHVCRELQNRTRSYGSRSIVVNKGVGDATGRRSIHYNADSPRLASFSDEVNRVPFVNNRDTLDIDMVTLDDYLQSGEHDEVSFIKVDTEGYEGEVLVGAASSIRRYRPMFIQIEFNRHQLFRGRTLLSFAEQLPEYDVHQLIPHGWVRRDPADPLANIFEYSNFVFVRRPEPQS